MRHALYVVGPPGAGKTTLVGALTRGWNGTAARLPVAHTLYEEPGVVELGAKRENGFSGTDALGMTAVVPASAWVQEPANPITAPASLLLAEGDRLAVDRFFEALLAGGWDLCVAHLAVPSEVAAERRARRAERLGIELQNPGWVKGRETKVERLVERWAERVVEIDGNPGSIERLAQASPVARALRVGV